MPSRSRGAESSRTATTRRPGADTLLPPCRERSTRSAAPPLLPGRGSARLGLARGGPRLPALPNQPLVLQPRPRPRDVAPSLLLRYPGGGGGRGGGGGCDSARPAHLRALPIGCLGPARAGSLPCAPRLSQPGGGRACLSLPFDSRLSQRNSRTPVPRTRTGPPRSPRPCAPLAPQ